MVRHYSYINKLQLNIKCSNYEWVSNRWWYIEKCRKDGWKVGSQLNCTEQEIEQAKILTNLMVRKLRNISTRFLRYNYKGSQ